MKEISKFKPPTPIDWAAISRSVSNVDSNYRSEKAVSVFKNIAKLEMYGSSDA
jgi:hypothetical protein